MAALMQKHRKGGGVGFFEVVLILFLIACIVLVVLALST